MLENAARLKSMNTLYSTGMKYPECAQGVEGSLEVMGGGLGQDMIRN